MAFYSFPLELLLIQVKVYILFTFISKGLQLVDFVSWSIFRKYEFKDRKYFDYIRDKITLDKKHLFFENNK